jgi:hypothetical protein
MSKQIIAAALSAAALAAPAAAVARQGHGHENKAAKHVVKKAKKVTFVFRGTFVAPGTVQVRAGNAHVRKGGFVGQSVSFDLAAARIVVADTNGDLGRDVADVKDGDVVLVKARLPRRTKYVAAGDGEAAQAVVARMLVDKTNAPDDGDDS